MLAACAALVAVSAGAAPPRPGQAILSGCRQGQCAWLRVVSVARPVRHPQGVLRAMEVRRGSARLAENGRARPIAWQAAHRSAYAFCSTRRPAFAFEGEHGDLLVHFLDPFDLSGYQEASARVYMRLCHGLDAVPIERRLRALGYRPGTRNEQVENAGIER